MYALFRKRAFEGHVPRRCTGEGSDRRYLEQLVSTRRRCFAFRQHADAKLLRCFLQRDEGDGLRLFCRAIPLDCCGRYESA